MSEGDQPDGVSGLQEGKSSKEIVLKEQAKALEKKLLGGRIGDTFRGINDLGLDEFGIDITDAIRGSVVADVGSGYGGLAKSAKAENIPTTIYSINPKLALAEIKRVEEGVTQQELRIRYPNITDEEIQAAQRYHDEHLSTNFAHDLTDFEDNSLDLIVDNVAVHAHMPEESEELYERTVQELLRVLKSGGKIIVRDSFENAIGVPGDEGGLVMKEKVLTRLGIHYEPIRTKENDPIGVIVYKE